MYHRLEVMSVALATEPPRILATETRRTRRVPKGCHACPRSPRSRVRTENPRPGDAENTEGSEGVSRVSALATEPGSHGEFSPRRREEHGGFRKGVTRVRATHAAT